MSHIWPETPTGDMICSNCGQYILADHVCPPKQETPMPDYFGMPDYEIKRLLLQIIEKLEELQRDETS